MNVALWRSGDRRRAAKCLRDKRVHVPSCPPQIPRGMGWTYFGFVADKVELGQDFSPNSPGFSFWLSFHHSQLFLTTNL